MIGDWLKFKHSDLAHKVHGIAGISVRFDNKYWYSVNQLEPVPLTEEILNKNFIEKNQSDLWYINDDAFINRTSRIIGNDNSFTALLDSDDSARVAIVIHYVHELQHALKLAKINKEIVL